MRPLLAINLTAFALCAPPPTTATETQIAIPRIEQMPNLPEPYHMRDWQQVAHDFDTLAFDFERQGEHLPIISWATGGGVDRPKVFAIPTFIGWNHEGYEAITCLGAVNAATVAGIDKSDQDGMDWVALCANYFNDHPGIQLYLNNDNSDTGGSFWYEIFPNILFYRIVSAYPDTPKMAEQFIAVAEQWYAASVAMGGSAVPWALPNYDITAYNFTTGELVNNGLWTEGGSAAGIAWLQYMAYTQTQNEKYLNAAKWGMEYLDQATKNPYYEILFPHSTYLAARMNAELGTHYDVTKLINWSLEGNNRRKWGDSVGKWGTMDFSAVTCSLDGNDAGSYGFAMNTFNKANSLVPMVRYDKRYAVPSVNGPLTPPTASASSMPTACPPISRPTLHGPTNTTPTRPSPTRACAPCKPTSVACAPTTKPCTAPSPKVATYNRSLPTSNTNASKPSKSTANNASNTSGKST